MDVPQYISVDEAASDLTVTDYHFYKIERTHNRCEGRLQLPVYGSLGTSSIVGRLHAAMETLKVEWECISKMGQPQMPDPLMFDPNNNFLYGERCGSMPVINPSMVGYNWRLWGTYYYAVVSPKGLTSDFSLGRMPFDPITTDEATIPTDNFIQGLLDGQADFRSPIIRTNDADIDDNTAFDDTDVSNTPIQGP